VFLTVNSAKIKKNTKFPEYWELWSFKILWNILWDLDELKENLFWKYCERFSWNTIFGKIAFNFKIFFFKLWKYLILRKYWAEMFGKILHGFKPCEIGKGRLLIQRLYFLMAQVFLFLDKKYSTWFYSRKNPQMFLIISFSQYSSVWAFIEKRRTEPLWVWLKNFQYWHTRTSLYLTIAWFEKHCSKVLFFISRQVSWVIVRIENSNVVWLGLRVRLATCLLQVATVVVIL